mgnify:CR=1 FL=1
MQRSGMLTMPPSATAVKVLHSAYSCRCASYSNAAVAARFAAIRCMRSFQPQRTDFLKLVLHSKIAYF